VTAAPEGGPKTEAVKATNAKTEVVRAVAVKTAVAVETENSRSSSETNKSINSRRWSSIDETTAPVKPLSSKTSVVEEANAKTEVVRAVAVKTRNSSELVKMVKRDGQIVWAAAVKTGNSRVVKTNDVKKEVSLPT
jgi:hypothetical protein